MLSMPTDKASFLESRKQLRFDKDTLHLLNVIKKEMPTVRDYVSSTLTVVSRSFLDNHINRSRFLEQKLLSTIETGHCQTSQRPVAVFSEGKLRQFSQEMLDGLKRTTETLEKYVSEGRSMTVPLPYVMMEAIANCHFRLVSTALSGSLQQDLNEEASVCYWIMSLSCCPQGAVYLMKHSIHYGAPSLGLRLRPSIIDRKHCLSPTWKKYLDTQAPQGFPGTLLTYCSH